MIMDDDNLIMNFENLEALEIRLIEVSHNASMDKDPVIATHGRCMKFMIPAWIEFIRAERDRNEEHGPGNSVYAVTRSFSLLTAITALGTLKETSERREITEALSGIFSHDIDYLMKKGKINGVSGEHESVTTH